MKKIFVTLFLAAAAVLAVQAGNPETPVTGVDGKPIFLTKADFIKKVMDYEKNRTQWVYKGDKPAIIDFYADWCGPCKRVAPVLEELAGEYSGKVYIYKVNIDKEPELASLFGIQNIPTFLVVPMKGKPSLTSGASANSSENKARFKKIIDDLLK